MYGFSPDLDLSFLIGRDVGFIGFDCASIYFNFNGQPLRTEQNEHGVLKSLEMDRDAHMTISGGWSLASKSGSVIDKWMEREERKSYQIHVLLGLKLLDYSIVSGSTLDLRFEGGFCLSVFDDSGHYESLVIEYGDTCIVV